jgi:hypothetical protein
MSTIVTFLHDEQHIASVSPGSLKLGRDLPHIHFLFTTSIIVAVLQDAQHIAIVSQGSLKLARAFPH